MVDLKTLSSLRFYQPIEDHVYFEVSSLKNKFWNFTYKIIINYYKFNKLVAGG